jgi:hypothetical protein
MMNFLTVYGQDLIKNKPDTIKPEINLVVVNGDTLFTINRKFAEIIAIEHDSLVIQNQRIKDYSSSLSSCLDVKNEYKTALDKSVKLSDMLKEENKLKDKIIIGLNKVSDTQESFINDLNKEFNKAKNRNKWLVGLTIGGVSVGFTSIILLLLK